jgi:hypothetical protein
MPIHDLKLQSLGEARRGRDEDNSLLVDQFFTVADASNLAETELGGKCDTLDSQPTNHIEPEEMSRREEEGDKGRGMAGLPANDFVL